MLSHHMEDVIFLHQQLLMLSYCTYYIACSAGSVKKYIQFLLSTETNNTPNPSYTDTETQNYFVP